MAHTCKVSFLVELQAPFSCRGAASGRATLKFAVVADLIVFFIAHFVVFKFVAASAYATRIAFTVVSFPRTWGLTSSRPAGRSLNFIKQ